MDTKLKNNNSNILRIFSHGKPSTWAAILLLLCSLATVACFPYARDLWLYDYETYGYKGYWNELRDSIGLVYLLALAALALCAFLLPAFRQLRKSSRLVQRFPAEFAAVLIPLCIYLEELAISICHWYASDEAYFYFAFLSFLAYMLLYGVWLLAVLSLLQILDIGCKAYLLEHTFLLRNGRRFFSFLSRAARRFAHEVTAIDLGETSDRWLLKIAGANWGILFIGAIFLYCIIIHDEVYYYIFYLPRLFLFLFWDMTGAGVYSILLFFGLRRYVNRVKGQYRRLLTATEQMAEGNLSIDIPEDLGIFEPIKKALATIGSGFQKAVDREMRSQAMKTELITNVSHDLKTPLTAIITYVNLLKDENITEEERRSYIDILDRKSLRLKKLIEDLFEVSKAASGNVELKKSPVDLSEMVRQAVAEQQDRLEAAGIDCRVRTPGSGWSTSVSATFANTDSNSTDAAIRSSASSEAGDHTGNARRVLLELDSEKTYRVLENLLVNVAKYALAGTRAWVQLEVISDEAVITVKNTSAQELNFDVDTLTERFVRGDKSRNTEGSGLGLAIVKNFVELQGGKFEIVTDGDLFKAIVRFPTDSTIPARTVPAQMR